MKYTDEDRERVIMVYASVGSMRETARRTGIPEATVRVWLKKQTPDKQLGALREEKRREAVETASEAVKQAELDFVNTTTQIMDRALLLLDRRITRALEKEYELDAIIDELGELAENEGMNETEQTKLRQRLMKSIDDLEIRDIRAITTAIGTLYDKRALAKGENTQSMEITVRLPEEVKIYAE